jgi:flotillin
VGIEQATRNADAIVAGLKAKIEAEKQNVEMQTKRLEAEVIVPAQADRDKRIEEAKGQAALVGGKAMGELDQLAKTLKIIAASGADGRTAYLLENFQSIIGPLADTLTNFPVKNLSVIAGAEGSHEPISSIHPHAIESAKNKLLAGVLDQGKS